MVFFGKKYDFDVTSYKKFDVHYKKVKKEIEKLKEEEEEKKTQEKQETENNIILDDITLDNFFQNENYDDDFDEINQYFLLNQDDDDTLNLS